MQIYLFYIYSLTYFFLAAILPIERELQPGEHRLPFYLEHASLAHTLISASLAHTLISTL